MKKNNLILRLSRFSERVLFCCRKIKWDLINRPIIFQLVKSSTSVGANYLESQNAISRKDFRNKIYICKKEINETKYWLVLLGKDNVANREELRKLYIECVELIKIFQSITSKL